MNTNELLSATGETVEYGRQYVDQQLELLRLETAKRVAMTTSGLITSAVVALMAFMVLIFISIALGFYLGSLFGSYSLAFFAVALLYLVITIVVMAFKRSLITNPLLTLILRNILD